MCATVALFLCLGFTAASCLNPLADDQPSNRSPQMDAVINSQPDLPAQGSPPSQVGSNPGANRNDDLENGIPVDWWSDSADEPDAGAAPADAGPDAQAPLVGGP